MEPWKQRMKIKNTRYLYTYTQNYKLQNAEIFFKTHFQLSTIDCHWMATMNKFLSYAWSTVTYETFNVFLNNSASLSSSGLQFQVLWDRKNKPNAQPPISIVDNMAFHRPPEHKSTVENAHSCPNLAKSYYLSKTNVENAPKENPFSLLLIFQLSLRTLTSSSAVTERLFDARCQLKSCQLLLNCTKIAFEKTLQ